MESDTRHIKVVYPDGSVIDVKINSFDIAKGLALSRPQLEYPVIILHKGRCLSPYLTLAAQNVEDNDIVVLKRMEGFQKSSNINLNNSSVREQIMKQKMEEVFQEILRLSDLQFRPYESSPFGGYMYQQMAEELPQIEALQNQHNENSTLPKPLFSEPILGDLPLPPLWKDEDGLEMEIECEEDGNDTNQMKKMRRLPRSNRIMESSSIE